MSSETLPSAPSAWSSWLLAVRPMTLSAAITPVLVGSAAAAAEEEFRPLAFTAALAASMLIQIGANLANDVFDFEKGADTEDRVGPPRVTQSGLIAAAQVRAATYLTFGAAAAIGLYLVILGGWPILLIGILAITCGLTYTGGPLPFGYVGLGDLVVFLLFGLAGVIGTYYVHAEEVRALAVATALPVGLMVTAILVVNNLRDIETDRRAGKLTLAVRIGARNTRFYYALLLVGSYLLLPVLLVAGAGPWAWLCWLSLPVAVSCGGAVLGGAQGRELNPILKRQAQLHLLFGGLLSLGLLL